MNKPFVTSIMLSLSLVTCAFSHAQPSGTDSSSPKKEFKMENQINAGQMTLIDKFFVPKTAINEFMERMNYNRSYIIKLPGFIKDEAFKQTDDKGNQTVITMATWQNMKSIDDAKIAVQAEYKRMGFNMQQFLQQNNIVLVERGIYGSLNH